MILWITRIQHRKQKLHKFYDLLNTHAGFPSRWWLLSIYAHRTTMIWVFVYIICNRLQWNWPYFEMWKYVCMYLEYCPGNNTLGNSQHIFMFIQYHLFSSKYIAIDDGSGLESVFFMNDTIISHTNHWTIISVHLIWDTLCICMHFSQNERLIVFFWTVEIHWHVFQWFMKAVRF